VKNHRNKIIAALLILTLTNISFASDHNSHPHIQVIGEPTSQEPFTIRIVAGTKPITFCLRLNVSIHTPDGLESAPRPVQIEQFDQNKNRWFLDNSGLPDIGVAFSPVLLNPNESRDFRLQVWAAADYRLKLFYESGATRMDCPLPSKRGKIAISPVIHVIQ
jgi:hypothetical protein